MGPMKNFKLCNKCTISGVFEVLDIFQQFNGNHFALGTLQSPTLYSPVTQGILPYSLGGGVPLGSQIVLPFTRLNFANFVTLHQSKNAQLFLISIFCERSC